MKRDVNNIPVFFKELLMHTPIHHIIGIFFLRFFNRLEVEGRDILKNLPHNNVLFVSNHQTFYMEGIALMTEFNRVRQPFMHWFWKAKTGNCYYIVAIETARKKGIMLRLIEWAGAVTVTRTWRRGEQALQRGAISMEQVVKDQGKVAQAIHEGWVITFPQGTITPFSVGRKGTAHIIKQAKCIVVPVVIDGFARAFHREKLCRPVRRGVRLKLKFKAPLDIDYDDTPENILDQVMEGIEQSGRYMPLFEH